MRPDGFLRELFAELRRRPACQTSSPRQSRQAPRPCAGREPPSPQEQPDELLPAVEPALVPVVPPDPELVLAPPPPLVCAGLPPLLLPLEDVPPVPPDEDGVSPTPASPDAPPEPPAPSVQVVLSGKALIFAMSSSEVGIPADL